MRDAEAWMRFAEAIGTHASPFAAAIEHIESMARDTALMRIGSGRTPTRRCASCSTCSIASPAGSR
jgi:hypothetical protein